MSQSDRFQITSVTLERIHYIQCPAVDSTGDLAKLKEHLEDWSTMDARLHVLDMRNMPQASAEVIKAIDDFAKILKKRDSGLISIHMSESIFTQVKSMGLEAVFNRVLNYPGDLYQKRDVSHDEMIRLLLKYLSESAEQAIRVSLQSSLSYSEKNHTPAASEPWQACEFMSVIAIDENPLQAEFRLYGPNEVWSKMAKAMLGSGTQIDEPVIEGAGLELLNMIYGQAKAHLNDKENLGMPKAIPRLVRKSFFQRMQRSPQVIIMTLVTPLGTLFLEVDILKFKA